MYSYLKTKISYFHIFSMLIVCCLPLYGGLSMETDTITSASPVRDPHTIMSRNQVFKLGFYVPENTTNRYVYMFRALAEKTPLWIANRDKPLRDSSGFITISEEGNLVLSNGENEVVWSTNITRKNINSTYAQILDTGNLVLCDNSTGKVIWESFSYPSHAWLPKMPLIDDTNTGNRVMISSWKNDSDPGIGSFKFGLQALNIPQMFIWHSTGYPHYRTGPWNGQIFLGSRHMYGNSYSRGLNVTEVSPGIFHAVVGLHETYMVTIVISSSGVRSNMMWNDKTKSWDSYYFSPLYECDIYGTCGNFGVCDMKNSPIICSCMKGFEPVHRQEWDVGNWTSGCKRKTQLQCKKNRGKPDGFIILRNMKVPDYAEGFASSNEEECKIRCLRNCSCIAYAYDPFEIGCMFWRDGNEALIDTQQFPNFGVDLHIRLAASELDDDKDRAPFIAAPVTVITFFILVFIFITRRWMIKKKARGKAKEINDSKANATSSSDSTAIFLQDQSKGSGNIDELPLFDLDNLAMATNQFDDDNLLGKGGFGHVYKGKLKNGKDIAVKRLSEASRQGIEEFLNEASVISKLQHRNLVRLIGCCVEKEEKMLIYEYMANKSLDICLFDNSHHSQKVLYWENRLNIIKGIGRGLIYLHRDSRLRIIHRDLKASNVLLDEDWTPKISDFGIARIFSANQDQANTIRVVGTYGYMAPEYATEGIFSEKSDVYSFGVLMLEIISGKKNSHCDHDLRLSLLGCAWNFLKEDNAVSFPDEDILNPNSRDEIVRCIHIALLCVQEFAKDRPTVQALLSMLDNEIVDLPMPRQPVFADKWNSTLSTMQIEYSINEVTVTELYGR